MDRKLIISIFILLAYVLNVNVSHSVNGSVAVVENFIAVKTVLIVIARSAKKPCDLLKLCLIFSIFTKIWPMSSAAAMIGQQ